MRNGLAALAALATIVACSETFSLPPRATVYFMIDAPLCSSTIPVQFTIDGAVVATDTFIVRLAKEHLVSRPFDVAVGSHSLSARTIAGYQWPARSVTIAGGAAFTDTLPFYCS